jgi:hypothetical protein
VADPQVPDDRPPRFSADVDPDEPPAEDRSWFAAGAVSCGLLGLFVLQIVFCVITLVLSALAWHHGEGDPWARKLARFGWGLGALDGLVWLICESVFHIRLIPF